MKKIIRKTKDLHHLRRHIKKKGRHKVTNAESTTIDKVRRLQASVYLHHGNVDDHQIDEEGFLDESTDPYYGHSEYFYVDDKHGDAVAGGRIILPKRGYKSLQIEKELPLDSLPDKVKKSAKKGSVCEISGLVKKKHKSQILPLLLLKEMYAFAQSEGYEYMLMSITHEPYQRFSKLFGKALEPLREPYKIPHGNNIVYPCAIHVASVREVIRGTYKDGTYVERLIKKLMLS